jgi:hypothetical protein
MEPVVRIIHKAMSQSRKWRTNQPGARIQPMLVIGRWLLARKGSMAGGSPHSDQSGRLIAERSRKAVMLAQSAASARAV